MNEIGRSAEVTLASVSHRPPHLLYSMANIDFQSLAGLPKLLRLGSEYDRPSSFGKLDRLPLELLHQVLEYLDVQSIARINRVSVRGRSVVLSLPAYTDLIKHAAETLALLNEVRLLSLHSVADLHAALRSERCANCPEYGAYFFLLDCDRCCWECLRRNPARRVIQPAKARRIFALSPKQIQKLPTLFSKPGHYGVARKEVLKQHKLVSVNAASHLALAVHGSAEKVVQAATHHNHKIANLHEVEFFQGALTASVGVSPLMLPDQGRRGDDPFFGMASTNFPSLPVPNGPSEYGLWCKGCEKAFDDFRNQRLAANLVSAMVPSGCDPWSVLLGLSRRAHSRSGLLEHIRHCHGAQRLLRT